MADTIRIATFNCNSIRIRLDQVLDWLNRGNADVLCLQETKVQDHEFPNEVIRAAGYELAFRGQKSYCGVAVISRYPLDDVCFGLDDDGDPDEARLLRCIVCGIPLVNTYVPQGRDAESEHFQYKLTWFERLGAFFARNYGPDQPLVWVGDFNVAPEPIDVYAPKRLQKHVDFHPLAREALARVREWGFTDVFRQHHPGEPEQYTYFDYRLKFGLLGKGLKRVHYLSTDEKIANSSLRPELISATKKNIIAGLACMTLGIALFQNQG